MTASPVDTTTDLHAVIAALRTERDAALSEKAALAGALATRNSEYGERIEQQSATIDVLKVMSASPGDPLPVFDLIVQRARSFCGADQCTVALLDGDMLHLKAEAGMNAVSARNYAAQFPRPVNTESMFGRAILAREAVQTPDVLADPEHFSRTRVGGPDPEFRAIVAVPMLRAGTPIGAIALVRRMPGVYSGIQMELLQTFAEQAVIAITSAETYRALQTRTSDLQETLEYQTATTDLLKVISRSTFNLEPVFQTVAATAVRLCNAEQAGVYLHQNGEYRWVGGYSQLPEYERIEREVRIRPGTGTLVGRVALEGRPVHILDALADTLYEAKEDARVGGIHTLLGVPLLRDGTPIGVIGLGRQKIEPFAERQIELVSTFGSQAVIAMENARLLTEQREALEQQTATAEVLQVINSSPGDLTPVFDAMLEKAIRLCRGDRGVLWTIDGGRGRIAAARGLPAEFVALLRERGESGTNSPLQRVVQGEWLIEFPDTVEEFSRSGDPHAKGAVEAGVRSAIWVAIVKEGVAVGAFAIGRSVIGTFSDKQIALLQNFAAQAVIAMENARLLTETREALEQQTATAEVLQVINSSPGDLTPVFDAMLQRATRLCGTAIGSFWSYNGEVFQVLASTIGDTGRTMQPSTGTALWRIAHGESVVQIADVEAELAYRVDAVGQMRTRLAGTRTALVVALRKDETLVGAITTGRPEVRPFTDKQIALLQNFAAQAVIAMENARLISEQREALEQQTATAEVLQVINASPGNLAPVFDAILEKAMRLCDAAFGSLYTYDGESFHSAAHLGVPKAYEEWRATVPPSPRTTVPARILKEKRSIHVIDLMQEEDYATGDVLHKMHELGGIRTALSVPLLKDDVVLGFVTIFRQEVQAFSHRQIALLESFAAQAVIAMENARLITEQREALEQQTATAEVLQAINANPGNLTPVFDAILEKAHSLCGAPLGSLVLRDGDQLRAVTTRGYPQEYETLARQGFSPTLPFKLFLSGEPFAHVLDGSQPPTGFEDHPMRRAAAEIAGVRTVLFVPLRKDETVLGYISAQRQEVRPFTDRQIALLQSFAAQAVIAMENARLLNETREALEQQTATAEVLQVINSSPGDLAKVFDAMLEKALTLCGAEHGSLGTYDGDYFRAVASRGYPAAVLETLQGGFHGLENPVTRPLFDGARFVHIPDLGEFDHPIPKAIAALGGFRTVLFVPLRKDGKLLGHISASRQEVRSFAAKEIALLENFAVQAVIAMENARLLDEIRQRQAELRVTFENMGDGVALFDETPSLVAWNRKFQDILDLPDGVLGEGLAFPDYIRYLTERGEYGEGAHPDEQIRRLTGQVGEVRAYERTRPDGRVIEIRRNPVPGDGFVLIFSDISERKRNEAEIRTARDAAEEASRTIEAAYRDLKAAQANLIQAEKMASLGQLTAGIAHEIKNPLNFVNNFAALSVDLLSELKETAAPGFAVLTDKQRAEVEEVSVMLTSNLEKITEHGKRADDIVKAMLEHSRGSSGERRKVDINMLADEALNLAYHGARAQDQTFNITLERDFGASIAPIEVNPQDITRVFLNLFSNGFYAATKRAHAGGDAGFVPTLKVTTRDADDAVEIRVRDNGTGIPADITDKLFQPFFTTKPSGEGTGLGLSISYDIVTQQHGGSITVVSKVGDHSEFSVRLPRNP